MIKCPNCKNEEFPGALFCSKCGAQFVKAKHPGLTTAIYSSIPDGGTKVPLPPFPEPPAEHKDATIALAVLDTEDVLFLEEGDEFSLGRATGGQSIIPDIDLSAYNAYETGVSRLHASIRVDQYPINVQDLGSVNGTRVNGKKLTPHSSADLVHGDILTLGKLKIQILVKE